MKLCEYYEKEFPEHSRTSCSDDNPINADVEGHGCWRCNAIAFTKAEVDARLLLEISRIAESAIKTNSRDKQDWRDDMDLIAQRAAQKEQGK